LEMSRVHHRPGEMILMVIGSLFRKPATINYPRKAITMTPEFELTQMAKGNLKVTYHATLPPAALSETVQQPATACEPK